MISNRSNTFQNDYSDSKSNSENVQHQKQQTIFASQNAEMKNYDKILKYIRMFDDSSLIQYLQNLDKQQEVYIDLSNSRITNQGIKQIKQIQNCQKVVKLNLSKNFSNIDDESLSDIAQCQYLQNLEAINLNDNEITDFGINNILQSPQFKNLKSISLFGCYQITDSFLQNGLNHSNVKIQLEYLDLRATLISDQGLKVYFQNQNCDQLQYLDISFNNQKITDNTLINISNSQYLKQLVTLKCDENKITNQGLIYMFENGKNLFYLQELSVSSIIGKSTAKQFIDDKSIFQLMNSQFVQNLKILNLKGSHISSSGLNQFLASKNSEKIEELKISWNPNINDKILEKIISIIHKLHLKKIFVNNTNITENAVKNFLVQQNQIEIIY